MPHVLDTELETFERERARLVATAEGSFALVRGREIHGTWRTRREAIGEGYRRFGNAPFLVKQVLRVDRKQTILVGR